MKPSNNLENKTLSDAYWRVQLVCKRVTEILCSFKLVLEGKTGKEIPETSRSEFLEKILAKNFALSYAEDNTSGLLNRGGIVDLLCWEHYWQFTKSPQSQVSGKSWNLLFY